jgi:3-isopropylmalate dehydrogenase
MHQTLLLLPGDGIGPEVIAEVRRVAEVVAPDLKLEEGLVGGASIDAHGDPLTEDTLAHARHASAVLLGAVGGPEWVGAARDKRPEAGLLALRKGLDVFANLRPAFLLPGAGRSLQPEAGDRRRPRPDDRPRADGRGLFRPAARH